MRADVLVYLFKEHLKYCILNSGKAVIRYIENGDTIKKEMHQVRLETYTELFRDLSEMERSLK